MQKTYLFAGASSAIAKETAKQLQSKGHRVIAISTKESSFAYDEFFQVEDYGFGKYPSLTQPINGLVYFPGTINLKPFARLTEAEFMNDLSINSLGAVAFTQTYLPNLKQAEAGSIVYISTVAVAIGLPFHASISMAKGAIEGLTKALSAELAPSIKVNCIAPSLISSPLGEKFISSPEKLEAMEKRNPMRKVGQAKDVANAVVFLLGEESSWVSGQIIAVDGGMSTIKN